MKNAEYIVRLTSKLHRAEDALQEAYNYQNFELQDELKAVIDRLDIQLADMIDKEGGTDEV